VYWRSWSHPTTQWAPSSKLRSLSSRYPSRSRWLARPCQAKYLKSRVSMRGRTCEKSIPGPKCIYYYTAAIMYKLMEQLTRLPVSAPRASRRLIKGQAYLILTGSGCDISYSTFEIKLCCDSTVYGYWAVVSTISSKPPWSSYQNYCLLM
jgi:hypothetical protein